MLTDDVYSSNCMFYFNFYFNFIIYLQKTHGILGYNVYSAIATRLGITTRTVQIMHTGATDVSSFVSNLKNSEVLIFLLIALPGDAIVVLEEARFIIGHLPFTMQYLKIKFVQSARIVRK